MVLFFISSCCFVKEGWNEWCLHCIFKWLLSKQTHFVDLHEDTGNQSPGVRVLHGVLVKGVQAWTTGPIGTQRDWLTFGMPREFIIGVWYSLSSVTGHHSQHKQTNCECSLTSSLHSADVKLILLMSLQGRYVTEGQEVFTYSTLCS